LCPYYRKSAQTAARRPLGGGGHGQIVLPSSNNWVVISCIEAVGADAETNFATDFAVTSLISSHFHIILIFRLILCRERYYPCDIHISVRIATLDRKKNNS
jgi:hypothetical protein